MQRDIGNVSRAPFIVIRAMRAGANHTSEPGWIGFDQGRKKRFFPIVGICSVHVYAFSVL